MLSHAECDISCQILAPDLKMRVFCMHFLLIVCVNLNVFNSFL